MSGSDKAQGGREFSVSKGYAYYVFSLLFLLFMFNFLDRMIISALIPHLKAEWKLTDYECGWFASIVTLMMTAFVFPISLLVDRWSRTKAISLMAVLWGLASAACAFARSYEQLMALRSFVGIGEAAFSAGGFAMIAAYFPEERRATMNGLFNAGIPMGTAFGVVLGGVIAESLGWRYAFGITALPGLVIALLFFYVKDYKTVEIGRAGAGGTAGKTGMGVGAVAREFLRTPSVLYTYVGYTANSFATFGLMVWLPTHFHRVWNMPMDKAGLKASPILLLAIVGAPLGGWITDVLRRRWLGSRMGVPALSSLVAAIALLIAFLSDGTTQYLLLVLFGFTSPMYVAGGSAVTQDVVHPGHRAISYGINQFFLMLIAYSLSPLFVGALSDRYGLMTAFRLLPICYFIGAAAFLAGSFYYARDLARVGRVSLKEA